MMETLKGWIRKDCVHNFSNTKEKDEGIQNDCMVRYKCSDVLPCSEYDDEEE